MSWLVCFATGMRDTIDGETAQAAGPRLLKQGAKVVEAIEALQAAALQDPQGGGEGRGGSTQAVPRRGCATAAVGCTTSAASLAPAYPCPRARTAGATTTVRRSSNTSQDLRTANANRRAEPGAATIRDGSRACHDGQASRQAGRAGAAGILAGA